MVVTYHGVVYVHQQLGRLLQQSHMEKIPASKEVHTIQNFSIGSKVEQIVPSLILTVYIDQGLNCPFIQYL